MSIYGQFCPVAKAAEVLCERWTLMVMRELLLGSRRFNALRRGLPKISPTLLSKRLQMLHEQGMVTRTPLADGQGFEYEVTQAGRELQPMIMFLGHWGQTWVRSRLTRDDLDPGVLVWFMHRHFHRDQLPQKRVVIHLEFSDVRRWRKWWIVIDEEAADLCLDDPGLDVDLYMVADLLTLTKVYMGDISLTDASSSGKLRIDGSRALIRSMPQWFARSKFADSGREPYRSKAFTIVEVPRPPQDTAQERKSPASPCAERT